jgi:hypothetical protein
MRASSIRWTEAKVLIEQLKQRHLAMESVAAFERTTVSGKISWSLRQRANAKQALSLIASPASHRDRAIPGLP